VIFLDYFTSVNTADLHFYAVSSDLSSELNVQSKFVCVYYLRLSSGSLQCPSFDVICALFTICTLHFNSFIHQFAQNEITVTELCNKTVWAGQQGHNRGTNSWPKNRLLLHFENLLKSTVWTDHLKAPNLLNVILSGRLFRTSRTLLVKKSVLAPLHLGLHYFSFLSFSECFQSIICVLWGNSVTSA